jgi:CRP/FNR family cyclic AMP-dependent transcriptional regulator
MAMKSSKRDLLRRVPLFAGLGTRDLGEIEQLVDEVDVPAGQELTREGAYGHEFFVIVEGSVRVEREGRVLSTLGEGDFLGEIALLDGKPRIATVTTVEPSRLLVLGHREFNSLIDTRPDIRLRVLEALAERIRAAEPEHD